MKAFAKLAEETVSNEVAKGRMLEWAWGFHVKALLPNCYYTYKDTVKRKMNALFNTCCKKMLGSCGLLKSFFPETNCRTSPRPFNFQIPVIKMSNIVRIWQGHSFLLPFHFHINFSEGQICWREERGAKPAGRVLMGG